MKLFGLLLAVSLLAMGNSASAQSDMPKPGSSEPMVSIVTAAGVSVSLTFQGDYGPNRMEGTLVSLPDEPIRAREGKQVREIPLRHLQELQRTPLGIGPDAPDFVGDRLMVGPHHDRQCRRCPLFVSPVWSLVRPLGGGVQHMGQHGLPGQGV